MTQIPARPGNGLEWLMGRERGSKAAKSEGLAVRRGPRGETLLYVISDNNYWSLQRTLLMMFEVKN